MEVHSCQIWRKSRRIEVKTIWATQWGPVSAEPRVHVRVRGFPGVHARPSVISSAIEKKKGEREEKGKEKKKTLKPKPFTVSLLPFPIPWITWQSLLASPPCAYINEYLYSCQLVKKLVKSAKHQVRLEIPGPPLHISSEAVCQFFSRLEEIILESP